MYLDFSICQEPEAHGGITLDTIFYIDADQTYHIPHKQITLGKTYLVVTLQGNGLITYNQNTVQVKGNTLMYMQPQTDMAYRCKDEKWKFWWFEFFGPCPIPANQLVSFVPDQLMQLLMSNALQYAKCADWTLSASLFQSLNLLISRNANRSARVIHNQRMIQTMEAFIRENLTTVTVGELCRVFAVQERTLRNLFVKTVGQIPKQFIINIKLEYAGNLLLQSTWPLSQIANQCGFANQYHFSKAFKEKYGMAPTQYRKYINLW